MRFPLLIFLLSLLGLWLSVKLGAFLRTKLRPLDKDEREDFAVVQGATLTLLGLIIGFSFSMAIARYDQRKNYEEEEANAIGTEFLRADLLPGNDGARVHDLLRKYLDQRIAFYEIRDTSQLAQINRDTAQLQSELWSVVRADVAGQPTPALALVASGMNDVLNSQGYTQAAWWNRIPLAAWILMGVIAIFSSLLIGNNSHKTRGPLFFILPLVVSVAFFLISDLDSPRGGLIYVRPQNLRSLSESLTIN